MELFGLIADWKLRKQRARTEARREGLTEQLLRDVTSCAFSVQHQDADVLASVQIGILASLPGVGMGLATAILALTFPEMHGVIDFRFWKVRVSSFEDDHSPPKITCATSVSCGPLRKKLGGRFEKADFMVWSSYDERSRRSTRVHRVAARR